ncbi:MAG: hypothetical protein FWD69_00550 [Polyangiaceae bacterium]|nr:hypothetical protein [Polyangiaceae bacterium]
MKIQTLFSRKILLYPTFACTFLFALGASPAFAETPQQIAEAHFKTGLKLYDQSSYEAARLEFLQAQSVYPRAALLRNLALCELKTNRPLEAIQHLRAYLADPEADKRELAKKNLEEALARTGHVNVQATDGTTLAVDGKPQPQQGNAPFKEALDVLPGKHGIEARLGNRTRSIEVDAPAGSTVEVDLRFEPPVVAPEKTAPSVVLSSMRTLTPPPVEAERGSNNARYLVSGSLVALGVVGVGLGIGFTAAANSAASDVAEAKATSGTYACTGTTGGDCSSRKGNEDARARDSNIAMGMYIGGGVLLAAGVTTYFVWPKLVKQQLGSVAPWIGKDVAGFAYGKEF